MQIFNRFLLKQRRDRVTKYFKEYDFIHKYIAHNLVDRLKSSSRNFKKILNLGYNSGEIIEELTSINYTDITQTDISEQMLKYYSGNKVVVDEEFISFRENSFDLILSNLVLHTVNDLPGCLIQLRNCLTIDGVIIASLFGGNSLNELRDAMVLTELELGIATTPHIFPFADVKDMGRLMQRAGFAMPVADSEKITVTYSDCYKLMHDLRGMAGSNILLQKSARYLGKEFFKRLNEIYIKKYSDDENNIKATFEVITITGIK